MTTTAQLTPQENQTPVVVNVPNELSGGQWVSRFPGSASTSTLIPEFRASADAFVAAMKAVPMQVHISSTFRPPQRAYLMHWAWKITRGTNPASVPPMNGVNIQWEHSTLEASIAAAKAMTEGYGIDHLGVPPALQSLHTQRRAIDMSISWTGNVDIKDADGNIVHINTTPRTGMNPQLKLVGATYSVMKFVGGAADRPHWSTNGH